MRLDVKRFYRKKAIFAKKDSRSRMESETNSILPRCPFVVASGLCEASATNTGGGLHDVLHLNGIWVALTKRKEIGRRYVLLVNLSILDIIGNKPNPEFGHRLTQINTDL